MKTSLHVIVLLTITQVCCSQTPRQLTKQDSLKIENEVSLSVQKLHNSLNQNSTETEYIEELSNEFAIDTFKIEERQRLKLDIDYSTSGMITSALSANKEYDKLLNKYYKILLASLNDKDKKGLRQTQRNWIKFRDSELQLNASLMDDYYSGGGTIQGIFAASRILELTKNRVIELYQYISRKAA